MAWQPSSLARPSWRRIRLGTSCWPWYRRRTNRRRTRPSLLRPARVLGAIRSMGTGISGLPIDARPSKAGASNSNWPCAGLDLPAANLSRATVVKTPNSMARKGSIAMAARTAAYGKGAYRWCVKRGALSINPFVSLPVNAYSKARARTYTLCATRRKELGRPGVRVKVLGAVLEAATRRRRAHSSEQFAPIT
jgi:hypothetical protein